MPTSTSATMIEVFLGGCLAGLAIAVPVGAVGTLIILAAASHGWRVGAVAGLGAATADGIYAAVAVLLGATIAPFITALAVPLRWLAGLVLVLLGALMIRSAFRVKPTTDSQRSRALGSPLRAYVTVLGITMINPTTVLYFAALVVGSPFGAIGDLTTGSLFVLGALLASAVWQLLLASGGSLLGRVLSGSGSRRWTTLVGGGVVVLLATKTILGV